MSIPKAKPPMRSLALTVLLSACVQPQPDSGARYTLTHYLAEIRLEDRTMKWTAKMTDANGQPLTLEVEAATETEAIQAVQDRRYEGDTIVSVEASR